MDKNLILFVHGLGGETEKTWGKFSSIVKKELPKFDIACFSYPSSKIRLPFTPQLPTIQLLAKALRTEINTKFANYHNITLVCHSLGGLIARKYLIEELIGNKYLKIKGLLLFAVPNNGADLAKLGKFISWRHRILRQLCKNSDVVDNINSNWVSLSVGKYVPTNFIVGALDNVVEPSSAEGFWGNKNVETISDKNHENIIQPTDEKDTSFLLFKKYVNIFFFEQESLSTRIYKKPYQGLEPFCEKDADYFFGRETELKKLCEKIEKCSFLSIIGPSGSGKSSLVFAGLKPILRKNGNVTFVDLRPRGNPFIELARALIPLVHDDVINQAQQVQRLASSLESDGFDLSHFVNQIASQKKIDNVFIIIDQFEELYTNKSTYIDMQRKFISLLSGSIGRQKTACTLIITIRVDFLGNLIQDRKFADIINNDGGYILSHISSYEQLKSIIEKPAMLAGVSFETHLVERILQDIKQRSLQNANIEDINLPLLEFTLTQLWDKQEKGFLSHATYTDIGEVQHCLSRHAEEVFSKFNNEEQDRVKYIFTELVHSGKGTGDTRRVVTKSQMGEDNWVLISQLANERLVTTGHTEDTDDETAELVHETLIKYWKRLSDWIDQNRPFRVWLSGLRNSVEQWEKSNRDDSFLWRGNRLIEAEAKDAVFLGKLNNTEKKFIQKSIERAKIELEEKNKLNSLEEINIELHKQQDLLIEAERYSALGHMSAQMTHVLRNPLTSIGGVSRILAQKLGNSEHKKYINVLVHETERLESTLEDLFDFVSQGELQIEEIHLYHLLRKTLILVHTPLQKQKISVISNFSGVDPLIQLDQRQMRMTFLHLINNSIEAMLDGGTIEISVILDEDNVNIIISDTGIGLSNSYIDLAKEPYYTTKKDNAGLGLALVEKVVMLHKGKFKLQKRKNHRGMRAEVILPIKQQN